MAGKKILILGAGESGVGAALLAHKKGYAVFVSDNSEVKKKYKETLDKNNIEFISSIPSCDFEISDNSDVFVKQSKGNFLTRFLKQITMIFNALGSDGGLFVLIGKKR